MHRLTATTAVLALTIAASSSAAAQHPPMPPGMTHEEHLRQLEKEKALKERGASAMGFDQDAATHHFTLATDGGTIEVSVNDPSDTASLLQIRSHLKEIAAAFARGTFDTPLATHGEIPPGVATLQERKQRVRYRYHDRPAGGRVVIATRDPRALEAIHAFLKYQIREHATGDPLS